MTEGTTPAPEGATPVVEQSSQAERARQLIEWGSPPLRPVFTPDGAREEWAHPCPPWCTGEGDAHQHPSLLLRRNHYSPSLTVKLDHARSYWVDSNDPETGTYAAHIEVKLCASSRDPRPRISLTEHHGAMAAAHGAEATNRLTPMYPDEVRELIAVLQHFLRVGMEGQ